MKIIKKSKKKPRVARDPKKESIFKILADTLAANGFSVRREKLRQGHGWKVSSGACQAGGESLLFVDRKMSQDEQISFLLSKMLEAEISPAREKLEELPESVRRLFLPEAA